MIEIPSDFFWETAGGIFTEEEYNGYQLRLFASVKGWDINKNYDKYYNVSVNKKQLLAVFSNLELPDKE